MKVTAEYFAKLLKVGQDFPRCDVISEGLRRVVMGKVENRLCVHGKDRSLDYVNLSFLRLVQSNRELNNWAKQTVQ